MQHNVNKEAGYQLKSSKKQPEAKMQPMYCAPIVSLYALVYNYLVTLQ